MRDKKIEVDATLRETSISKNMRWSYQKRMENGTFLGCTAPHGYALEDGKLRIIPEEAAVIQNIFAMRLAGFGQETIAKTLNQQGVPTREGAPWYVSKIHYILTNEKYVGDSPATEIRTERIV